MYANAAVADLQDSRRGLGLRRQNNCLHLFQRICVECADRPPFLLGTQDPGQYILKGHAASSGFKMIFW